MDQTKFNLKRDQAPLHDEPRVVYHYTSLDVLTKIVETRRLWATSIGYLNDTSESVLYQTTAGARLEELLEANPELRIVVDSGDKPQAPPWKIDATFNTFVTSFSLEDDSLPQWRAYTPAGLGVRIGFKVEALKAARVDYTDFESRFPHAIRNPPKLSFGGIKYLNSREPDLDQEQLLSVYKTTAEEFIYKQSNGTHIGRFDIFLEQRLGALGCLYKDDSFRAEAEYRLVAESLYWPYIPVHFRSAKSALVPFIKLELPNLAGQFGTDGWDAIDSIKIGPTPNEKITLPAVAALVTSRNIRVGMLSSSGSTYRDL